MIFIFLFAFSKARRVALRCLGQNALRSDIVRSRSLVLRVVRRPVFMPVINFAGTIIHHVPSAARIHARCQRHSSHEKS